MFHRLTVSEWIDRFSNRLGALLPAMDPTEVTRRAVEVEHDAYQYEPEEAAEVYALELPPLDVDELSDYEKLDFATWKLAFRIDGLTEDEKATCLGAAVAVLEARGVTPQEGMLAEHHLHNWDDAGFPDDLAPSPEQDRAYSAWADAWYAAQTTTPGGRLDGPQGELVLWWPSKVRWEAARERWLARTDSTKHVRK